MRKGHAYSVAVASATTFYDLASAHARQLAPKSSRVVLEYDNPPVVSVSALAFSIAVTIVQQAIAGVLARNGELKINVVSRDSNEVEVTFYAPRH